MSRKQLENTRKRELLQVFLVLQ